MARRAVLSNRKQGRGNSNCGNPPKPIPAFLTDFEMEIEELRLARDEYVGSAELYAWCHCNRNRCYVPEWLLKEWGIEVEAVFSGAA